MSFDLAQILLESGRIPAPRLEEAKAQAAASGKGLDEVILGLELVSEDQLADILGRHYEIPGLSLARMPRPNPRVQRLVSEDLARRYQVVPLEKAGETLILLMADPTNIVALDLVRTMAKADVQPVVGSPATLVRALDTYYASAERRLLENVVPFVGKLITEEAARAYKAIPVDRDGNVVTVAIASAEPEKARKAIEMATGLQVRPIAARWEDVEKALERVWRPKPAAAPAATPPRVAAAAPAAAAPAAAPMADLSAFLGGPPTAAAAAAPASSAGALNLDFFGAPNPAVAAPAAIPVAKPGNGKGGGALNLDVILGA